MANKREGIGCLMQIAWHIQKAQQIVAQSVYRDRIDNTLTAFADVVEEIVEKHIAEIKVSWQSSDPHKMDWNNEYSTLIFSYGTFQISVMVKLLAIRDLILKVRTIMQTIHNSNLVGKVQLVLRPDIELDSYDRQTIEVWTWNLSEVVATAKFYGSLSDPSGPGTWDASRLLEVVEKDYAHGKHNSKLRAALFGEEFFQAEREAREFWNSFGLDPMTSYQETDEDGNQDWIETDHSLDLSEMARAEYWTHRLDWKIEELTKIAKLPRAKRAVEWRNNGVQITTMPTSLFSGSMHQRTWNVDSFLLRGEVKKGKAKYRRVNMAQDSHVVPLEEASSDAIMLIVEHDGGDIDKFTFKVIDSEISEWEGRTNYMVSLRDLYERSHLPIYVAARSKKIKVHWLKPGYFVKLDDFWEWAAGFEN